MRGEGRGERGEGENERKERERYYLPNHTEQYVTKNNRRRAKGIYIEARFEVLDMAMAMRRMVCVGMAISMKSQ